MASSAPDLWSLVVDALCGEMRWTKLPTLMQPGADTDASLPSGFGLRVGHAVVVCLVVAADHRGRRVSRSPGMSLCVQIVMKRLRDTEVFYPFMLETHACFFGVVFPVRFFTRVRAQECVVLSAPR